MALPKSVLTERGKYLRGISENASGEDFVKWPTPTKDDYVLIGGYIVIFSYVDMNLRRILDSADHAGVLPPPWKGRSAFIRDSDLEKAVLSLPGWSDQNKHALLQIQEYRPFRNLLAHFAIRRFPNEDAFIFITRSVRDFIREFGERPAPGVMMSAVADVGQIKDALKLVEGLGIWLSQATADFERQVFGSCA